MKIGLFILFLANSVFLYSQNITEIYELSKYDVVAGPKHGYSAKESDQWQLYKIISENYSSEIIELEYYRTESIISKLYLYWILRDQNWKNTSIIYEDLLNYKENKLWFSPGWCIMYAETIEIEKIINYNYNEMEEKIYNIDFNDSDLFNYFIDSHEIVEQLYIETLYKYLKLPYLKIE